MAIKTYLLRSTQGCARFTADDASTDADAKTVAQSIAMISGVKQVLYKHGDTPGVVVDTKTPGSQGGTVSAPSNVKFEFWESAW